MRDRTVLLLIAGAILAYGLGIYWAINDRAQTKAELSELQTTTQAATESNKISGAVLVSNAQEKAVAARSGASVTLSVQASIQKAPEWARQPVPKAVQEALNAPD